MRPPGVSQALNESLKQPNGARFYRCALQVNPFPYHGRHGRQTAFRTEADYNATRENCLLRFIAAPLPLLRESRLCARLHCSAGAVTFMPKGSC